MRSKFASAGMADVGSATESSAFARAGLWSRVDHCPHCHSHAITKWGRKSGSRRFRCTQCKRTFTTLTNTDLAHLRHRERWISFIGAVMQEKSLRESAAICGISLGTAQRWRSRLITQLVQHGPVGLVLLDSLEAFVSRL